MQVSFFALRCAESGIFSSTNVCALHFPQEIRIIEGANPKGKTKKIRKPADVQRQIENAYQSVWDELGESDDDGAKDNGALAFCLFVLL